MFSGTHEAETPNMLFTRTSKRRLATTTARCVMALVFLVASTSSLADEPAVEATSVGTAIAPLAKVFVPNAFFAQLGLADEATASTAGLSWNTGWDVLPAPWAVYLEASVSRWRSRGGYPSDGGVLTQLALIPVFRHRMDQGRSPWFMEGGVGVTVTSSLYRSGATHFSTSFNFGSHVGAGYSFGAGRQHEVSLRVEHFSNAGIKHPNPGENFAQLRYLCRFD